MTFDFNRRLFNLCNFDLGRVDYIFRLKDCKIHPHFEYSRKLVKKHPLSWIFSRNLPETNGQTVPPFLRKCEHARGPLWLLSHSGWDIRLQPYPDNSPLRQFPTIQVLVLMSGFIRWLCSWWGLITDTRLQCARCACALCTWLTRPFHDDNRRQSVFIYARSYQAIKHESIFTSFIIHG